MINVLPGHWTDTAIAFEGIDFGNISIAQFKIKHFKVRLDASFCHRFRNNDMTTLNLVANQNLGWCFVEFLSDSKNLQPKTYLFL